MKFWRYVLLLVWGVVIGVVVSDGRVMDAMVKRWISITEQRNAQWTGEAQSIDVKIESITDVLHDQYLDADKIDGSTMRKRAIKAYVDGLGDPFTVYLDGEENKELQEWLSGEENFEWIGAKIMKKDKGIMIEEVLKWSPALAAGLKPLDLIVEVDGKTVDGETLRESVKRIRWPKDSVVSLVIWRWFVTHGEGATDPEILTIDVTRWAISYPSVTGEVWDMDDDKKVWYIAISSVGDTTDNLVREVIQNFHSQSLDAVVVDLRGNGGGFLEESVEVASYFVPARQVVVSSTYRIYKDDVFLSHGYAGVQWLPMVVMVDAYTASAGEIIALALRDLADATIVWSTTFGKWTIQTVTEFGDGSSLKYTVGERLPPSGDSINGTGVVPDLEIKFDMEQFGKDASDNQIEYVKQYLGKKLKK